MHLSLLKHSLKDSRPASSALKYIQLWLGLMAINFLALSILKMRLAMKNCQTVITMVAII